MAAKKRTVPVSAQPGLKHSPFSSLSAAHSDSQSERHASAPAHEPAKERTSDATLRLDRKLVIRREFKGRGGKTITRIAGLSSAQRELVAPRMKKQLGCGAVHEGDDLLLLGDLVDRAAAWLEAEGATRIVKG